MLFTALKSVPLTQNCELGFFTSPRSQFYHYTDIPAGKELVCNTYGWELAINVLHYLTVAKN